MSDPKVELTILCRQGVAHSSVRFGVRE